MNEAYNAGYSKGIRAREGKEPWVQFPSIPSWIRKGTQEHSYRLGYNDALHGHQMLVKQ